MHAMVQSTRLATHGLMGSEKRPRVQANPFLSQSKLLGAFHHSQSLTADRFSLSRPQGIGVGNPLGATGSKVLALKFGNAPTFRAVSYNLGTLSRNTWKAKAEEAFKSKPDILFVQGAGSRNGFTEWATQYAPNEYKNNWAFVDSPYSHGLGMGIFYNQRVSDVVVVPHINRDLEHYPDQWNLRKTRPFPEVHFVVDGKVHMAGMTAHLSFNEQLRDGDIQFIRQRFDDLQKEEPYTFFMGTVNDEPDSEALEILSDAEGERPMAMVPDLKAKGIDTYPSSYVKGNRYDHILVSPNLLPHVDHQESGVFGDFQEGGSGHLPIQLNLTLPESHSIVSTVLERFGDLIEKATGNAYCKEAWKAPEEPLYPVLVTRA